jgi:hypothetical protein
MRAVPKVTAMRQTKERRKTYLGARAVEMAGSGKYRDWEQIEFALCFDEGYLEARGWLDSRPRREWLNQLCREAQDMPCGSEAGAASTISASRSNGLRRGRQAHRDRA